MRPVARAVHAVLLLPVLIGSAAYLVGAGWRGLVGIVPTCQGDSGLVTCISGQQRSGLAWYGTTFAVVMWLAMLRWSTTRVAVRIVGRTVITLGTGMYVASLIRGPVVRAVSCDYMKLGKCRAYFPPLSLTEATLGLVAGAVVAFALIPPRLAVRRAARTLAPA
jgi:hypothetical protein